MHILPFGLCNTPPVIPNDSNRDPYHHDRHRINLSQKAKSRELKKNKARAKRKFNKGRKKRLK